MKILRDESGYVLVLRRPQVILGGKTAEKEQESNSKTQEAPKTQTASCAVAHCCFFCTWCGKPIFLPNDRIGAPFGNPEARKIDVRSIATVCSACKHIGNYSMFRSCEGYDTRHKIVLALNGGTTLLLNWLQCTEKTCTARVPLFVRFDEDPAAGETETAEWLWNDLTCASGHAIKPIPIDPTFHLPLRTFGEFR